MKAEQYKLRLRILSGVVILLLSVLLIRLAVLQLFYNDLYQTQAKENSIRLVSVKAPGEKFILVMVKRWPLTNWFIH